MDLSLTFVSLFTHFLPTIGSGGEYTVQTGFGWTNGVAIWLGGQLGANLTRPDCPAVIAKNSTSAEA